MKLDRPRIITLPDLMGGVQEDAEPGSWDPRKGGVLDRALNFVPTASAKLGVRGGGGLALRFAEDRVSDVLGLFPFSPTGALCITHSASAQAHYAYALTDTLAFALPAGNPTELGSRVELGADWATATAGRPNAVELFEKLYVADASDTNRRSLVSLAVTGGALVATTTDFDLDGTPGNEAPMRPYCVESFASVLFAFGFDSEAGGIEPAFGRHSFLGIDPSDPTGFDKDAFNIFGAKGQPVRAAAAGKTLLLAAKENELYRITGAGRGLPGWQFAFQPLNDSEGRGCTNAHALEHVDGRWYGAGRAGPWLSDGAEVFDLLPARLRSWKTVDALDVAWVRHHPDRQAVLFAFHVAGVSGRGTAPFDIWLWDLVRERWTSNWRFPQSFHMARAIASGTTPAPSGVPDEPTQSFDFGEFEFSFISGTTNAADLTASIEVWTREAGGATTLAVTLPPGIQRFRVPASISKVTFVKLRHVKNGAAGEFSGEVACYTRLQAPQVAVGTPSNDGLVRGDYLTFVPDTNLHVADSSGFEEQFDGVPAGFTTEFDLPNDACFVLVPPDPEGTPDQGALYSAWTEAPSWPTERTLSAVAECHTLAHKCCGDITTLAPEPRQRCERGGMDASSIVATYFPAREGVTFRLQYRKLGASDWLDGPERVSPVAASGVALSMVEDVIVALEPSSRYEVRVLNADSGTPSAAVTMFTQLAAPTLALAAVGSPGSPRVNLTVTPAASADTLDLMLYNALGTYQALIPAVAGEATYQSTDGVCGSPDRYFARTRSVLWPEAWQFSDAATADVDDPCVAA